MIDVNTILVIVAYALAIIGGVLGQSGRKKAKEIKESVNQSTQRFLNALAKVNDIAQNANKALSIITDIVTEQKFNEDQINELKTAIEDIKNSGGAILSIITEFWTSLKDLLGLG